MRPSDMKLWQSFGLVYAMDNDQTSLPKFGLTDRALDIRGVRQFETAIKGYQALQDERRAALAQELGYGADDEVTK